MREAAVGVVVVSDKAAAGLREDGCVDALGRMFRRRGARIVAAEIVPDEIPAIRRAVRFMADRRQVDLVVTCGGTGLGPRDVTPEAVVPLLEKIVPGIGERMRAKGIARTPTAVLSRSTGGSRGTTLILVLPGSPVAAAECLSAVWAAIPHALALLRGEVSECGRGKRQKAKGKRK